MKSVLVALVSGLSVLSIGTRSASAQSPIVQPSTPIVAGHEQKAPGPSQVLTYVPSEIATSWLDEPDEDRSREHRKRLATPAKAGRTSAERAVKIPSLCFEPEIGWTKISAPSFAPKDDAPIKPLQRNETGTNSSVRGQRELSSSDRSSKVGGCPPNPSAQAATVRTYIDSARQMSDPDYPILPSGPAITEFDSHETVSAAISSARANSGLQVPEYLKTSQADSSVHPGAALEQLKALEHREYVSPVRIRRLGRNMENLETRLELRMLNAEVEKRKARRPAQDYRARRQRQSAAGHKQVNHRNFWSTEAECTHEAEALKSNLCSQVNR